MNQLIRPIAVGCGCAKDDWYRHRTQDALGDRTRIFVESPSGIFTEVEKRDRPD